MLLQPLMRPFAKLADFSADRQTTRLHSPCTLPYCRPEQVQRWTSLTLGPDIKR